MIYLDKLKNNFQKIYIFVVRTLEIRMKPDNDLILHELIKYCHKIEGAHHKNKIFSNFFFESV